MMQKRMGDDSKRAALMAAAGLGGAFLAYRMMARNRQSREVGYPPLDTPKPVADNLWIVDSGPIRAMGLALPVRMTIIRLADGDLLLHSPTPFSLELSDRITQVGPIRHLVAPSMAHWMFVADWQRAFPDARTWAAPGVRDRPQVRKSGVRIDAELGEGAPDAWAGEIEQGIVPGGLGFREIYFLHRPSRTLVLTDLIEGLEPTKLPPFTRGLMTMAGASDDRPALYLRAVLRLGGAETVRAIRSMVALEPERVIFAHGRFFADRGGARLTRAFAGFL
ncbi:DUF4336 domain-containing protein [uncultured Sphingomonas sp.]|uniref:DUF4336 domain-containing protein n=1 Tax=uncultured Sphingomonas sp. TaxID=158754 RepID=UPI0025E33807|nr:DUF4336 domain-containing protein [uncultured Sphingomonas sp.]